ncbi:hypothetical protein HTY52_22765 [Cupriavidus taiwanensis]|uniref:hypothetical protein n=1 Tax=Cupriavidus taiwanensis TaxID=164546 RepID=UPI0015746989|nr:hypothetical protein [Cupriavidus taiwanensis]NSX16918.1 hypothetical protein [Cupriavidus taiwanensis]
MLPHGARPILEARMHGQRPADLLIVSLVGAVDEANPVILAKPDAKYDWRFLLGLKVCVFARPGVRFAPVLLDIGSQWPAWLALWDVENEEGTDAIVHIKPDCLDKSKFGPGDFATIFWPWTAYENRKFKGEA